MTTAYDARSWPISGSFADAHIKPWTTVLPESASAVHQHGGSAVTRESLIAAANARLEGYAAKGVSDVAVQNASLAISFFANDDAATPQVGLDGEGGVETDWVVDGRSLVLNCMADGTNVLWAIDRRGKLLFRDTFNVKWMAKDGVVYEATKLLGELSKGVQNRLVAKA